MADANHYAEAADGLDAAAKALRACGEEEASEDEGSETPQEKQPKTLKSAATRTRQVFRSARKMSVENTGKPASSDAADDGNKPLPTHK